MGRGSGGTRHVGSRGASDRSADAAVEYYVSGEGMWINKYLRDPQGFVSRYGDLSPQEKKVLSDLDRATGEKLSKDMTLYRSVDASSIFGRMSDTDWNILNDRVAYNSKQKFLIEKSQKFLDRALSQPNRIERGFMSTSKSENVAVNWRGFSGSERPIVLKMNIPKGTRGQDASRFDVRGNEQYEVLLGRNQRYKINSIYGKNGSIYVDTTIL